MFESLSYLFTSVVSFLTHFKLGLKHQSINNNNLQRKLHYLMEI